MHLKRSKSSIKLLGLGMTNLNFLKDLIWFSRFLPRQYFIFEQLSVIWYKNDGDLFIFVTINIRWSLILKIASASRKLEYKIKFVFTIQIYSFQAPQFCLKYWPSSHLYRVAIYIFFLSNQLLHMLDCVSSFRR